MEQALQDAVDEGKIKLPLVVVDFSKYGPTGDHEADKNDKKEDMRLIDAIGRVTSLQLPHRLADAILRDSQINGDPFRRSERGKALNTVSAANATPLFELCPTALVFGMWDSTGPKGGLGPKFERAMVSEIVGVGVVYNDDYRARGVRRDPLNVRKAVKVVRKFDNTWRVAEQGSKGVVDPAAINHGNVPFDSKNSGVTIEYAEQLTTLSLISLRRLRFPVNGKCNPEADAAARTVLAALGLCGATLAFESGMGLRSRCLLWPDGGMLWELLDRPSADAKTYSLSSSEAIKILGKAIEAAKETNLPWPEEPLVLEPSSELLKLVCRSQLEAMKEGAEEA